MDKEDCIQVVLSALQQPQWKLSNSVTDWDLKNVLWKAGLLLIPEQVAALFADMKRRGLISGSDRRSENQIVALWAVRLTTAGEEWLAQRTRSTGHSRVPSAAAGTPAPPETPEPGECADEDHLPEAAQGLDDSPPELS